MGIPLAPVMQTFADLLDRAIRPALRPLLARSLPTLEGALEVPGLDGPVGILRDRFGVPQVFAGGEHDLFFAQGYVHAQDRFFQMELQRRAGHGRLSELLGKRALPFDRLARTVGFSRIAARSVADAAAGGARADTLRLLEAYSAGVNACLAAEPRAPELTLLRHRPEPWTPADTAAWSLVMAWSLSESWESELSRGDEDPAAEVSVPAQADPGGHGAGSNAWAVAPWRSASGNALLAGDPHLALGIPCLWYEVGLYGGRYRVAGASLPGAPGVVIGHNQTLAWSVTAALTDVQDLFIERFSEENPTLYEHRGEWLRAEVREEEIKIRGRRKPAVQKVRTTRRGPVITDAVETDGKQDLSLRWATPEPLQLVEAGLAVDRARDEEQFLDALQRWQAPNQNFVYADRQGNVGWALAGPVPIRRGHSGDRPVPGRSGEHEWEGFLPFEEMPRSSGPESGIIASANEVPDGSHPIPGAYLPGYRKARIETLLESSDEHTLESFREIQSDLYCAPAHALARWLAETAPSARVPAGIMQEVAAWDGELTARSRPGAVARVALEVLLRRAAHHSSRSVSSGASVSETNLDRLVPELLSRLGDLPEDDLRDALQEAVGILAEKCGPDPAGWGWGALHEFELRHPLGLVEALAPLFNRGPYPAGGDANTVRLAAFRSGDAARPRFGPVTTGPNYRFVVDVGDWDRGWSMTSPGQSGNTASPNYDDQLDLWLRVRYRPMVFGRKAAELAARHRLVLKPEKSQRDLAQALH